MHTLKYQICFQNTSKKQFKTLCKILLDVYKPPVLLSDPRNKFIPRQNAY